MIKLTAPIIVPADHPSLADHFPGKPVAPGALVLDLMTAACMARLPGRRLCEITSAKFLKPVAPGVVSTLTITEGKPDMLQFELRSNREELLVTATMRVCKP